MYAYKLDGYLASIHLKNGEYFLYFDVSFIKLYILFTIRL